MILLKVKMLKVLKILIRIFSLLLYSMFFLSRKMEEGKETAIESVKTKVKPSRLLLACMHNRAYPLHYRSEYVRGYLHRKRCV